MATPHMPPPHSPDSNRFIQIGEEATGFLEDHLKNIVMVIAAVLLLAAGWVMIQHNQEKSRMEAQDRLVAIAAIYPGDGGGELPEPTIREAIEQYTAFIAEGPSGTAPFLAQFNLGRAYEAVGDAEAAANAYKQAAQGPAVVAGAAGLRLGYLLVSSDDKQAAGEAFSRVISTHPGLAPQAATEIAYLAEMAGATEVAIEHYRQIMKTYSNAPQASEAQARIRALGGELPGDNAAAAEAPAATDDAEAASTDNKGETTEGG